MCKESKELDYDEDQLEEQKEETSVINSVDEDEQVTTKNQVF